jgi:O-antigen/teichoic acid export membrane protein
MPSLWIASACCLAGTAIIIWAEALLPVYSIRHEDIRLVLRPICLGATLHAVATMLTSMYRAQSRQRELFWWTVGALIMQAGLLVIASVLDLPLWCYATTDAVTLLGFTGLLVSGMNVSRHERTRFLSTLVLILAFGAIGNEAVSWICTTAGDSIVLKLVFGAVVGFAANSLWMPFAWQTLRCWSRLSTGDLNISPTSAVSIVRPAERQAA